MVGLNKIRDVAAMINKQVCSTKLCDQLVTIITEQRNVGEITTSQRFDLFLS